MSSQTSREAVGLFPFTQFELSLTLGPADGSYLVRSDDGPQEVIVFTTVMGQPAKTARRRPRPRPASPISRRTPPVQRITVVRADPFEGQDKASAWLEEYEKDLDRCERRLTADLKTINGALHAHRAATGNPYVPEVNREQALTARIGYGQGADVAAARWRRAIEVPLSIPRETGDRRERLDPQEKLAAILSGREEVLIAEELVLRAKLDLDASRAQVAALQTDLALEALLHELGRLEIPPQDRDTQRKRQESDLEWLKTQQRPVEEIANAALGNELDADATKLIKQVVECMERVLRRRRYALG